MPLTALDGRTYTPKSVVFDIPEGNDAPEVAALRTGGTLKGLTDYGQQLAATEYNAVNLADEYHARPDRTPRVRSECVREGVQWADVVSRRL
jgi:L-asparaginase/Glu-tRNA(Gln) amidotransferase subunit D